jgi:hypothetical protein
MKAYKVMRYDPNTQRVIAGADNRVSMELSKGMIMTMPSPGIFMSNNRQYVLDYYSEFADIEALITFEIDPNEITTGNTTDREPEFTVLNAKVIDFKLLNHV